MPNLKSTITQLAETFASGVLSAIRGASLSELLAETGRGAVPGKRGPGRPPKGAAPAATAAPKAKSKGGRLERRSSEDIEKVIGKIVAALKTKKSGRRSEELQKVLGLSKKEIVRPIELALKAGKIKKTGEKRATTYFAK